MTLSGGLYAARLTLNPGSDETWRIDGALTRHGGDTAQLAHFGFKKYLFV